MIVGEPAGSIVAAAYDPRVDRWRDVHLPTGLDVDSVSAVRGSGAVLIWSASCRVLAYRS